MKKIKALFIVISIALCALPLVMMAVRPTTVSTENRSLAKFPSVTTREGKVNLNYFSEFEKYFSDHFAFRNELVYADAMIQKNVFKVSSSDGVILGKEGWLYYSSTLDDYLGIGLMSEREIYNAVHNLSLVQKYVEGRGGDFLFTAAPNKNTLYGENMPYYASKKVGEIHNLDLLTPEFKKAGIKYADLFKAFKDREEVLYLKRDSHWNNMGALYAYNVMMDELGLEHDDYSAAEITRTINEDGDLNRMLYTLYGRKEANYRYDIDWAFSYGSSFKSVEDPWIETKGGAGERVLLMSRDSFGNTLIPFFADQFKEVYFTKASPYGLERMLDETWADTVIMEKVERNIRDLITAPPIISSPEARMPERVEGTTKPMGTIQLGALEYDVNYYKIYGTVEEEMIKADTDIIVRIAGKPYEAFHTGDTEYAVYIKKDAIKEWPVEARLELRYSDGKVLGVAGELIEQ